MWSVWTSSIIKRRSGGEKRGESVLECVHHNVIKGEWGVYVGNADDESRLVQGVVEKQSKKKQSQKRLSLGDICRLSCIVL